MVEANPKQKSAPDQEDLSHPSTSAAQATVEDPEESKGSPRQGRRE